MKKFKMGHACAYGTPLFGRLSPLQWRRQAAHTQQKHTHKPWCAIVVAVLSLRRHHHHPTFAHRAVLWEALVDYGAGMPSPGPRVTTWKDGRRSRLPFRVLHIMIVPAWTSPRSPIILKAERDPSDGGVRQTAPLEKRRNRRPRYWQLSSGGIIEVYVDGMLLRSNNL